jgi:hypothetical protein
LKFVTKTALLSVSEKELTENVFERYPPPSPPPRIKPFLSPSNALRL